MLHRPFKIRSHSDCLYSTSSSRRSRWFGNGLDAMLHTNKTRSPRPPSADTSGPTRTHSNRPHKEEAYLKYSKVADICQPDYRLMKGYGQHSTLVLHVDGSTIKNLGDPIGRHDLSGLNSFHSSFWCSSWRGNLHLKILHFEFLNYHLHITIRIFSAGNYFLRIFCP